MARLPFEVVDVFTDTPYAGNPLAVVSGAEHLSTEQLQAIAREFNLSETAFPLDPTPEEVERGVSYRLRIFTASRELPFAGHPSVGTAWLLAARGRIQPGRVVQACGAGDLPLDVPADGGPITLTGGTPTLGEVVDAGRLAAAYGLGPDDLTGVPAQLAGTGVLFCYLHVHPDAVPRAAVAQAAPSGAIGTYVVGWPVGTEVGTEPVRARMFSADGGIEDPATGSAALGLAVHAVASGLLPPHGTSRFSIAQGVEIGRPARLDVAVDAVEGRAVQARVSGRAVAVSAGTITVPA